MRKIGCVSHRTWWLGLSWVWAMVLCSCDSGLIRNAVGGDAMGASEIGARPEGQCLDIPPQSDYPCPQQAASGKCDEGLMQGFCDSSCGRCPGGSCQDVPPDSPFVCARQAASGQCDQAFMQGFCDLSCGRCDPTPKQQDLEGPDLPMESPDTLDGAKLAGCNVAGGSDGQFLKEGPYGWKTGIRGMGPFTYVPKTFGKDGCKYPVIAFSMGTFAPSFVYTGYYTFLASWGFVVVVDPTMMGQMSGGTIKSALDWLYKSEYASNLSPKAGTIGHSQGGGGAFNASGHQNVAAIVGLEPGQFPGPLNKKPYLGLAGTLDMFGMGTNPLFIHWGLSSGSKFYANLSGADHIFAPLNTGNGTLGSHFRAAATAWFCCYLAADQEACALFKSGKCDKLAGRWADCKADKL